MKYTRRLIIIPDAEIGPEAIDSVSKKSSAGDSLRAEADFDVEASPVVEPPERGARYRQYQHEQDGDLDLVGTPQDGTAVSVPVKKFKDDKVKTSERRYTNTGSSTLDDVARSAHGEGDIVPVLTGTPEAEGEMSLLLSNSGAGGSARYSFNTASESRTVRREGVTPEFKGFAMPGDAQFRGSPLVFHKAPDLLISSDGVNRGTSTYTQSPNVTIPWDGNSEEVTRKFSYYCRPKLLPLSDGRLMAMYLEANLPVQHWVLGGNNAGGADDPTLTTVPCVQYASGKDAKWSSREPVDFTNTIFYAAGDPSTTEESKEAVFFMDAVEFVDTKEIVMVLGVNTVAHVDFNLFETGDYPPFGPSDHQPEGIAGASINISEFAAGAVAEDRSLCILSSFDGGVTWSRRAIIPLKTWTSPSLGTSFDCDVPGIDSDDSGLILGGACELSSSGRLLVTLCTSENVYILASDNRGVSFRANKIKSLAVGPSVNHAVAHMATPPPEGDLLDGQIYIPARYDLIVISIVSGDMLGGLPSGAYIVGPAPEETVPAGNPLFSHPNEIFDWDAQTQSVSGGFRTPPYGGTAFQTGLVNVTPAIPLIFDSESDRWLQWDARGAWGSYKDEEPLVYTSGAKGPWSETPTGAMVRQRVAGWGAAEDQFGGFDRSGMVLKVEGGDRFAGEYIRRGESLASGETSIWSVVEDTGALDQAKARDTMVSAGMARTGSGEVCISVSYTDFEKLTLAPDFISASLMMETLGKDYYNRPKYKELAGGRLDYGGFWLNPIVYHTARKTSVFITNNGEFANEQEAWVYQGGSKATVDCTAPPSTVGERAVFSLDGSPCNGDPDGTNFGPSCFESTVTIRPDGFPQIYAATHNWMPPEFIGPQADRYLNDAAGVSPLFTDQEIPQSLGIMNVVAGKTFSSVSPTNSFSSSGSLGTDYVDQINLTNAQSESAGTSRDVEYDIFENEISFGKNGTKSGSHFEGQDPRRVSGAFPAHGTTSYYVPNGFVHPGAMKFSTRTGITYTLALVWGLKPSIIRTEDPDNIGPGPDFLLAGTVGLSPWYDHSDLEATWGLLTDVQNNAGIDNGSFFVRYGFKYQPGTKFLGPDGEIWEYLGGERNTNVPNSWSVVPDPQPFGSTKTFDYSKNRSVSWIGGAWVTQETYYKKVIAPEYATANDPDDNMGKYYAGFCGGVSGVDAVQWRGQTVLITAHTQQYNTRSYSWSDPNDQRTRSLIGGAASPEDNSSIVVYRSSSWQPIRENLGRIDNAWDIGMGANWANTLSVYHGPWWTDSEMPVGVLSDTDMVEYILGGKSLNARNRLVRLMAGRFYQCTFDGQRDPGRLGWNVEKSAFSQMYLIDASMPSDIIPVTGAAPLSIVASEGGGCVLWRAAGAGSVIYLGGHTNNSTNVNRGFLPFSEGRQCAPISDGMKMTSNGSALTGGFRIVFSPFSSESYSTTDFKVFFSLLLNNKEWLPPTDVDPSGSPPTAKMAGIIVSLGYDTVTRTVTVEAFDGGDLFANKTVSSLGAPTAFNVPDPATGLEWFELIAGFDEAYIAHSGGSGTSNSYPRKSAFHAFVREWNRSSDPDWSSSFSTLVNYGLGSVQDIPAQSPYEGPGGSVGDMGFNHEHFIIGNMGNGIGGTHTNASEGGVVIKTASLHRPGQQIKGAFEVPLNVASDSTASVGGGIYDTRLFGTAFTCPDSEIVAASDQAVGKWLEGDVTTSWGGIDPRYVLTDADSGNFYYGQPYFTTNAGSVSLGSNDSGVLNPTRTQLCLPTPSWVRDGIHCEWRGSAQEVSTFAVKSSHLFAAENMLEGPVTKRWETGPGGAVAGFPLQREENWVPSGVDTPSRRAKESAYVVENVEIILDSWGDSGDAASGDYVNDIYNNIATQKQFSPNGIAVFGKNFPAFEIAFADDKDSFDTSFTLSFGLPGDGLIVSTSADWADHEPDKYIHLWAWTSESYTVGNSSQSPLVSGGKDKFPYFGDHTFTYRTNVDDGDITSIDNIYAKNEAQEKATPWMPHQFKSKDNGPSFYVQVISEGMAGDSDQACRFVFKIVDNTEDTLILDENPLRSLSQYSYDKNNMAPHTGEYRSWKAVAIFSDRMASEIVYSVITTASKRIGADGFITDQVPSLPATGFRYLRVKILGCTRFGKEKANRLGRLVLGRMLDLSGPDFEWGWSRSEKSGVKVMTTRGGQRYSRTNHAPRRVFNVSHHPLEPQVDVNTHAGADANYFEATRRGFGSSFGPGWKQQKRKWEEVVALLRTLGPGSEEAALVFEGDSALASKQPGSDTFSRTQVPTDPSSLCLVRLSSYGQMTQKGYVGRHVRVPQGSQSDATSATESFGSTVCRPRPMIEVTAIQFEEEF
jgi:hypothetical protein